MSDFVKVSRQQLEMKGVLGVGGFSTVYKVILKRPEGNIEVAAKKLNEIHNQELNMLARLKHDHIVRLIGVVNEDMDFFLILELCENGSLRSYLDKQNGIGLPLRQLLDWIEQAALPIQYLNNEHIIHKDIKAANYLLSNRHDKWVLKLSDFGLAKNVDKTQSRATARGTWAWMAPELLKDGTLSVTFDIYAYGMTVWEMATTQVPFKDKEYQWIVFNVCNNKRPSIPKDCPLDVRELIESCWQQEPHNRQSINHVVRVAKEMNENYLRGQSFPMEKVSDKYKTLSTSAPEPSLPTHFSFSRRNLLLNARLKLPYISRLFSPHTENPGACWEFVRQFGDNSSSDGTLSDARGIAINNFDKNVVVADRDKARANVYDSKGRFKFALDSRRGLERGYTSRPCNVAVSRDGLCYFVTDETSKVSGYEFSGAYTGSFFPVVPGMHVSPNEKVKAAGLAINSNGDLLVGVVNKKYISQHTADRSHKHLSSIRVGIEPYNLAAAPNNNIVVSSYKSCEVHLLSETGNALVTFSPPDDIVKHPWSPYAVCCNDSSLFVCYWTTDINKGIHRFSLDGTHRGCVIPLQACHPKGIAIPVSNDEIYVAKVVGNGSGTGVNVYRRSYSEQHE